MTIEKKLDALIDALGFDVEEVENPLKEIKSDSGLTLFPVSGAYSIDYKLTKRKVNGKSELHRIVREYESGRLSVSEMLNDIAKIESVSNE